MPKPVLGSLTASNLIATAVICMSFAAYASPLHIAALAKERAVGDADQTRTGEVPPRHPGASSAELDDRSYLLETASPGATMVRQGPDLAIARLNPEFVTRLAGAIREARQSGLPSAGIFSAYRPPAFGIGGFSDKFNSPHAYGLAVDMSGIGEPGSREARLWHDIAARHGVFCPYGVDDKNEWNHCQATPIKKIPPDNPLRGTITAEAPRRLDEMFKVGNSVIEDLPEAISMAEAANAEGHSTVGTGVVREAAASGSERFGREALRRVHSTSAGAIVRAGRRIGTKTTILAGLDVRQSEKSHRKAREDVKPARLRKIATSSAGGHRVSARHRSRSA